MQKIFISLMIFLPCAAHAWGPTGHRAVGLLAERHLTTKAKKNIKRILGQESLALACTWMDDIRSDSLYTHMTDWHWVTIETGKTYDESIKNPKGDVIMTLERIIEALKAKKLNAGQEKEHLKILLHLIGDIHMPLHVGCCGDQGGNQVRVKWQRNDSNLHRVWDSDMIEDSKLSYTELAAAIFKPDAVTVSEWQQAGVRDWARESMDLRKQVYATGDGNLGYRYAYRNFDTVKLRISQASIRVAGVLNEIYK